MRKLVALLVLVMAALLGVAPAHAHLVKLPDSPSKSHLENRLASQTTNVKHARYVCNNGANAHKRWACTAVKWLSRERNETRAALAPPATSVYEIARAQAFKLGVSRYEWDNCAAPLISRENANPPETWDPTNWNDAGSDAYGLGQALPPSKMAPWGSDYMTNPATQIRWMHAYVQKYGGWCGANSFQLRNRYY